MFRKSPSLFSTKQESLQAIFPLLKNHTQSAQTLLRFLSLENQRKPDRVGAQQNNLLNILFQLFDEVIGRHIMRTHEKHFRNAFFLNDSVLPGANSISSRIKN